MPACRQVSALTAFRVAAVRRSSGLQANASRAYASERPDSMNVLIVDNRGSFTFNLSQVVASVTTSQPIVVPNNCTGWRDIVGRHKVQAVLISPGPGTPARRSDFGTCLDLILESDVPLLGVCLGHQGLGHAYGARVQRAPVPMHGRSSRVTHYGGALFDGIPQSFDAVRYHSLCLDSDSIPGCLEVTASTADGIPMAVSHRHRPQFGVQFHPESVSAEYGERLIRNFLRLASGGLAPRPRDRAAAGPAAVARPAFRKGRKCRIASRLLERWIPPQRAFELLYRQSANSFWLDSSAFVPGVSRFSVMGDDSGPRSEVLRYRCSDRTLAVGRGSLFRTRPVESLVSELRARLARPMRLDEALPFDCQTGLVGFFGYEMRNELGSPASRASRLPDAAFIDADRCVVFDHEERQVLLVASAERPEEEVAPWFDWIAQRLSDPVEAPCRARPGAERLIVRLADGPSAYRCKIRDCLDHLAAGDSYQICLTSEFSADFELAPYDAYLRLRDLNPAPHAAYLRFGDFAVLSSSPERFLRVSRDRIVSAKPIKGTCARGADSASDASLAAWLRSDEKSRSENLMIADLLRNDIGRVAAVGSVRVPKLIDVESYSTVHHLVSTVTGRLRPDRDCLDLLESAFPGGSMTGAPKQRTLAIIDRLERRARGPYSGALGFLSYGDRMDLSIVIRAIVTDRSRATIGAGGGIVALSDPRAEFDEMVLKARAPLRSLAAACTGDPDRWELRYATP